MLVPERRYQAMRERIESRLGPLSTLILLLVGAATLLGFLTWLVVELARRSFALWEVRFLDLPLVTFAAEHRVLWLDHVMEVITALGSDQCLWAVVLLSGLVLRWISRSWWPLLILVLVLIGALSLDRVLKLTIARPRPPLYLRLVYENDWSFPSGHATKSAAVYVTVAYFIARTRARQFLKGIIYSLGVILLALIGVSRVYLGVHWPSDVLGGWVVGIIWATIVLAVSARDSRLPEECREKEEEEQHRP
jgi:undecaprenyl-diphosphatase